MHSIANHRREIKLERKTFDRPTDSHGGKTIKSAIFFLIWPDVGGTASGVEWGVETDDTQTCNQVLPLQPDTNLSVSSSSVCCVGRKPILEISTRVFYEPEMPGDKEGEIHP